ncbi:MAG: hypothetical protein Q9160_003366 [Pyrenula sp. 1 TL-2023]
MAPTTNSTSETTSAKAAESFNGSLLLGLAPLLTLLGDQTVPVRVSGEPLTRVLLYKLGPQPSDSASSRSAKVSDLYSLWKNEEWKLSNASADFTALSSQNKPHSSSSQDKADTVAQWLLQAPNLMVNGPGLAGNSTFVCLAAIAGQATIILMAGLMTFYWGLLKPTHLFSPEIVFSLFAVLFYVVKGEFEACTDDRKFGADAHDGKHIKQGKPPNGSEMSDWNFVIIQKATQLGDEQFASFAITNPKSPARIRLWKTIHEGDSGFRKSRPWNTATAVSVTAFGFIIQFVGTSMLHYSVSVVLVGISALMLLVRSIASAGLARKLDAQELLEDHEIANFVTSTIYGIESIGFGRVCPGRSEPALTLANVRRAQKVLMAQQQALGLVNEKETNEKLTSLGSLSRFRAPISWGFNYEGTVKILVQALSNACAFMVQQEFKHFLEFIEEEFSQFWLCQVSYTKIEDPTHNIQDQTSFRMQYSQSDRKFTTEAAPLSALLSLWHHHVDRVYGGKYPHSFLRVIASCENDDNFRWRSSACPLDMDKTSCRTCIIGEDGQLNHVALDDYEKAVSHELDQKFLFGLASNYAMISDCTKTCAEARAPSRRILAKIISKKDDGIELLLAQEIFLNFLAFKCSKMSLRHPAKSLTEESTNNEGVEYCVTKLCQMAVNVGLVRDIDEAKWLVWPPFLNYGLWKPLQTVDKDLGPWGFNWERFFKRAGIFLR